MLPSVSAPRLKVGRAFQMTDPTMQEVDAAILAEQREVNSGVRSTFSAVHSTLRSQGAAIRGLEEILKKMLPELDRLAEAEKNKADVTEVTKLVGNLGRLAEDANQAASQQKDLGAALDTKFDAQLGQRALEAIARQQQQVEQEAAAREAVGGEVVRLAASCASFASLVEAVRADTRRIEPRVEGLEKRAEASEAAIASNKADLDRRVGTKAERAIVDKLVTELRDEAEESQRRWTRADGETRRVHAEVMRAVETKMERRDAQQALDALAEQIARQAHEHAQAGARLAEAMAARVERSESASTTAQSNLQAEVADTRAEIESQLAAVQIALDSASSTAESQLQLYAAGADRASAALQTSLGEAGERIDTLASQLATLRTEAAAAAQETTVVNGKVGRTAEEVADLSRSIAELLEASDRQEARSKAFGHASDACTSQLRVCTERLDSLEERQSEAAAALGTVQAAPPSLKPEALEPFEQRLTSLERALTSALEELRRRELGTRESGLGLQEMTELMQERMAQIEVRVSEEAGTAALRFEEAKRAAAAAAAAEMAANTAAANAAAAATAAATAVATPPLLPPPPPARSPPRSPPPPERPQLVAESIRASATATAAATGAEAAAKSSATDAAVATRLVHTLERQVEMLQRKAETLTEDAATARRERDAERAATAESRDALEAMQRQLTATRGEMAAAREQMAGLREELAAVRALASAPSPAPPPAPASQHGAPSPMVSLRDVRPYGAASATSHSTAHLPSALSPSELARFSEIEEAQRAAGLQQQAMAQAMTQWSQAHARTIELLWSQALTGRWVGLVGGGGGAGGLPGTQPGGYGSHHNLVVGNGTSAGAGVLVCWHEQAANSHESCFVWTAHAHEIRCTEAGLYEATVGLWPPTAGLLGDLRVSGATALLLEEQRTQMHHTYGEAAGLCAISLLSIPAGATISLAVEHTTLRTKAFLGLRKL